MNEFSVWRLTESPVLESGHTFSLTAEAPHYRMTLVDDVRHEPEHLFHNPHGVWSLIPAWS